MGTNFLTGGLIAKGSSFLSGLLPKEETPGQSDQTPQNDRGLWGRVKDPKAGEEPSQGAANASQTLSTEPIDHDMLGAKHGQSFGDYWKGVFDTHHGGGILKGISGLVNRGADAFMAEQARIHEGAQKQMGAIEKEKEYSWAERFGNALFPKAVEEKAEPDFSVGRKPLFGVPGKGESQYGLNVPAAAYDYAKHLIGEDVKKGRKALEEAAPFAPVDSPMYSLQKGYERLTKLGKGIAGFVAPEKGSHLGEWAMSAAALPEGKAENALRKAVGELQNEAAVITKKGVIQPHTIEPSGWKAGASREVRSMADSYIQEHGMPQKPRSAEPVAVDPRAPQIADAYAALKHDPKNPKVKASYDAFAAETKAQFDYARKQGMNFEPWDKPGQPYANSAEMVKDVRENNHLYFFRGGEPPKNHPMSGVDPESGLTYNEEFRAVHDLFGHAQEGNEFGPK